ncbi:MAG: hypothetical protein V3S11_03695, partial [Elusimicrobiota bacterium]
FKNGVQGMLQVDILARTPIRRFALDGDKGRLVWDQYGAGGPAVSVEPLKGKSRRIRVTEKAAGSRGLNSDAPYIHEVRDFLRLVRAKRTKPKYSLADDIRVLKTLDRIRRHSHERAL